jgi:hypothetical protein
MSLSLRRTVFLDGERRPDDYEVRYEVKVSAARIKSPARLPRQREYDAHARRIILRCLHRPPMGALGPVDIHRSQTMPPTRNSMAANDFAVFS